ncbi:MAG: DNA helicase PcrA [Lachnospiraceae bacterium]|nr:DNA helicase PcrA [Lachnospiraceae bacterium]
MSIYDSLNPQQQEAVRHYEGPLLILAGAGSGKTRVLTHRVAWLIEEMGVNPWNILAITFTNKAAGEMRERVDRILNRSEQISGSVWVSTFHSTCVRILRRYIDHIGYDTHFTIYDSDDQKAVIRDVCKRLNIDTKTYKERYFMGMISSAKDELITPEEYEARAFGQDDLKMKMVSRVYKEYQKQLHASNALDFDDLISKTVELFSECPEVLDSYQERFRFIMVDEYQDTNTAQFKLVSQLASKYRNLCVVGDDDQSIYRFRGANIGNILNFEEFFPDAKVIRLEQNYRSTQNILDAANAVIKKNVGRKEKTLWTSNGEGAQIHFRQFMNGFQEAEYVADRISTFVCQGKASYKDFAVLYRTNAQSRMFEEKFLLENISYKIVGAINFYARKEIKDVLAYLKTIDNAEDDLAVRRITNVPRRGIGATSIARVQDYALTEEISFYRALGEAAQIPGIGRGLAKLEEFVQMIQTFRSKAEFYSVRQLIEDVLDVTGYRKELELEGGEEAKEREENIDELLNKAAAYDQSAAEPSLSGFLEEVALVADIDEVSGENDQVLMMTLHSAKGLEFPTVFLVGMEDGLFPGYMSIMSDDPADLEEERRLCYVGITRAQKELYLTAARQRMTHGEVRFNRVSRFVEDIPQELLQAGGRSAASIGSSVGKPSFGAKKSGTDSDASENSFGGRENPSADRTGSRDTYAMEDHDAEPGGAHRSQRARNLNQNAYRQAREAFQNRAFVPQRFEVKKSDGLDYTVGDRVKHVKFGEGTVAAIAEGGRDYEVTVEFDRVGTKKMFAAFAKLVKTE